MMLSTWVSSCSGPSMAIRASSPRAAQICSFSSQKRGFSDIASSPTSACWRLGRMPTMASRAAHIPRPLVRVLQAGQQLRFQLVQGVTAQRPRRDIDLDVEPAELRGPGRVPDRVQHIRAAHRRRARIVHQVDLNLETHLPGGGLEPRIAQHPREHVQALTYLFPVAAAVLLADRDRWNVPAHSAPPRATMGDGLLPTLTRQSRSDQTRCGAVGLKWGKFDTRCGRDDLSWPAFADAGGRNRVRVRRDGHRRAGVPAAGGGVE